MDKGMSHILSRMERDTGDFITPLRMACGLKFMNCFWNFPSNIFRPWLQITETTESETADDREDCILSVNYNFKILAFYLKF